MRLRGTKTNSVNQGTGLGDQLYDLGGARPTLDLNFSSNESLVDSVTGKTLVEHTRQSSATYVDGDGVIRTAVTNLLLQSEDFSTTWATSGLLAFGSGSTTNAAIAPDGTLTADLITDDGATNANHFIQQTFTGVDNAAYTLSVYAKSGTTDYIRIRLGDKAGTGGRAWFDLSNGTVTSVDATYTASIQSVGDGWYRLVLFTPTLRTGAITPAAQIFTQNATGTQTSYQGDGSSVYLWGAQLEQSSTVGQYVKTTTAINSAPRFDHDPTTGESLGLLAEEERTNLVLNSDTNVEFSNAASPNTWTSGEIAPDGSATAKICTTNNRSFLDYAASGTANSPITYSVYLKATSSISRQLQLRKKNSDTIVTDISSISLTTEWQRFEITGTSDTDGARIEILGGIENISAWGAQLEAGSFPTSYIPTEGSQVTRAPDVTSITGRNFGSVNLVQYSEEFNDSYWTKTGGSIAPNTLTAPNSTFTADKLIEDATNSGHFLYTNFSWTADQDYVFSVNVKKAEDGRYLCLCQRSGPAFSSNLGAIFDPTDGSITTNTLGTNRAGSESLGNGWYRCWIIVTPNISATTSGVNIRLSDDTVTIVDGYTGDGTSGVYLWGAQLEEGSTATDYIKSDVNFTSRGSTATYYDVNGVIQTAAIDEARTSAYLPDGNGNFVSAGDLLLEGAGTNLARYSEDFSSWTNTGNLTTVSSNATTAPDGTITADKLIPNTAEDTHLIYLNPATVSGTISTFSVYAKAGEYDKFALLMGTAGFGVAVEALYDLTNGTSTVTTSGTNTTSSITNVGNGWYRCVISSEATATSTPQHQIRLADESGNTTFIGDDVKGLFVWGAQIEHSPYPTSYIQVLDVVGGVTRAADVSTSAATFGNSWYEQSEGTVFSNTVSSTPPSGTNDSAWGFDVDATTGTDRMWLYHTKGQAIGAASGSVQYILTSGAVSAGETLKVGFAFKENDIAYSANSASPLTDTSALLPTVNRLYIGKAGFIDTELNGTISRLTYWPTRLSNDTLQTITT